MKDETGSVPAPEGGTPTPAAPDRKIAERAALIMSSSPHVHGGVDVPQVMRSVVWALVPAVLLGLWFFGLNAVRVLALSVIGCLVCEWLGNRLTGRRSTLRDWSAIITGVLLAMNLPSTSPWWMVLAGCVVAILLAKVIYGGLGYNPFNPALVARVFLLISFPVQMTTWAVPSGPGTAMDAATGATPLGALREALSLGHTLADIDLVPFWKMLVGFRAGSLGEVSVIALLLGGLFLLWKGIIRWQIPVGFIGTVFVVTGVCHLVDPQTYVSPVYHVLSGGLFLGAFFMATDMVTSPVTRKGMLIFGVGCGLLTAVIRLWGGYPEGVSFAILLMNAATPLIDRYTRPRVFGAVTKEAKAA